MWKRFFRAALMLACVPPCAGAYAAHLPEPCEMKVGPETLRYGVSQPTITSQPSCETIPGFVETVISLNAQDSKLREMLWDVQFLRDVTNGDDAQRAELHLPFSKYQNGVAKIDYFFNADGFFDWSRKYTLVFTARSEDGSQEYIARQPIVIDETVALKARALEFFSGLFPVLALPALILLLLLGARGTPRKIGDQAR